MALKILVIAALFALLLLLLYSKLYPYLQVLKKIVGVAKAVVQPQAGVGRGRSASAKNQSKLVRCVGCGTWVPAERAISPRVGAAVYCSRECLEKPDAAERRKAAS
jgi:hypothetical protein